MYPSPLIRLLILAHLSISFSAAQPIEFDDEVAIVNKALVDGYLATLDIATVDIATVDIAPRNLKSTADMVSLEDSPVLAADAAASEDEIAHAPSKPQPTPNSKPAHTAEKMEEAASTSSTAAPSSLGSGAMAGIVVVAVLLTLCAIACVVFFLVIRKRRKRRAAEEQGIYPVFVTPRSRTTSDASVTVIGDGDDYDKDAQFITSVSAPPEKEVKFVTTVSEFPRDSVRSNRSSISAASTIQHPEASYDYHNGKNNIYPDPNNVYDDRSSVYDRNSVYPDPNAVYSHTSVYDRHSAYNHHIHDRHSCYRDSYFPDADTYANINMDSNRNLNETRASVHSIKSTMLGHNGWLGDQRSSLQSFHTVQSTQSAPSMRALTRPMRRNTISTIASDRDADHTIPARRPTSMQTSRRTSVAAPESVRFNTLTISTASNRASLAETRASIALSPAFNQVITLTPVTMTPATPFGHSPSDPRNPAAFLTAPLPPLPSLPAARPLPSPRSNTLPSTVYVQPVQARPTLPLRIQIAEPVDSPESPSPISSGSSLFSPTALIPPAPFGGASDEVDRHTAPDYDSPHTERLRSNSDGSSIQEEVFDEHRY